MIRLKLIGGILLKGFAFFGTFIVIAVVGYTAIDSSPPAVHQAIMAAPEIDPNGAVLGVLVLALGLVVISSLGPKRKD